MLLDNKITLLVESSIITHKAIYEGVDSDSFTITTEAFPFGEENEVTIKFKYKKLTIEGE